MVRKILHQWVLWVLLWLLSPCLLRLPLQALLGLAAQDSLLSLLSHWLLEVRGEEPGVGAGVREQVTDAYRSS